MYRIVSICALLSICGCGPAPRPPLTVAAASNLTQVFQQLGPLFEQQSGIHPLFSFGSTANLTRQIENSAPFDLLAAADTEHVDELDRKGLLLAGSRAVYATGILAVWIPSQTKVSIHRLEDLTAPRVRVIAMAKPELAPYGQASVEALKNLGIWEAVKSKIVYSENISMAKQFGSSGNAEAVFTAYSLVQKEGGKVIVVDQRLHQPISQTLGIMAASPRQAAARKFADFLVSGKGKQLLLNNGYR
jgi:molybdate transport system substrate-binding protein